MGQKPAPFADVGAVAEPEEIAFLFGNHFILRLGCYFMASKIRDKHFDFSAVVFPEAKVYVSWCPELDVASHGESIEEALDKLKEAVSLHLECLQDSELKVLENRNQTQLVTKVAVSLPA